MKLAMGILVKTNIESRKEPPALDPFESFLSAIWERQENLRSNRRKAILERLRGNCGESENTRQEACSRKGDGSPFGQ